MNYTLLGIGAGILGLILLICGWLVGVYNMLVIALQTIKNQWSNVKAEYQRRADLFYNLAASIKSYKTFENETFVQLAQARNGQFGKNKAEEFKTLKDLDKTFSKFLLTYEAYPQLKASELYHDLNDELKMTENRINIARTDYNVLVRDYNILIKTFPNMLIAAKFGFSIEAFYESEVGTEKAPKLEL